MNIVEGETFRGRPRPKDRDNHAWSPPSSTEDWLIKDCDFIANGASEALKFSNNRDVNVIGCNIWPGVENGLDIVRGSDYSIRDCRFLGSHVSYGRDQDVIIKGGADRVLLKDCTGIETIVLGQYSIYDWDRKLPKTRNVHITGCGNPLVICWNAERPTGECRVVMIPSFIVKIYFWWRGKIMKARP